MSTPETPATPGFDRARAGLWASLQKHMSPLYAAETAFLKASGFATDFPFSVGGVPAETLAEYWRSRHTLRDLYTDETAQLDTLTNAELHRTQQPRVWRGRVLVPVFPGRECQPLLHGTPSQRIL